MHKIQEKEFDRGDFSYEHLKKPSLDLLQETINLLNKYRLDFINPEAEKLGVKKDYWWQMIQLLPSSYNQTRNVMLNYEVLANIYKSRKNHKLDEWREFCKWIEKLPYSELICGPEFLRKNFNIPEETIDKFNSIGNSNPLTSEELKTLLNNEDGYSIVEEIRIDKKIEEDLGPGMSQNDIRKIFGLPPVEEPSDSLKKKNKEE